MRKFKDIGITTGKILLPKEDFEKWAVVACDQYTSEPEYWERVDENAGATPSTLRITLPEIYLKDEDVAVKQDKVNASMDEYLLCDVFREELTHDICRTSGRMRYTSGIDGMC